MIDNTTIDFYGADWCGDCRRAKAALDRFGVAYNLHDIEHEDGAAEKAIAISGQQHIPVIRFAADGSWSLRPHSCKPNARSSACSDSTFRMPSHEPDKENCLLFGS